MTEGGKEGCQARRNLNRHKLHNSSIIHMKRGERYVSILRWPPAKSLPPFGSPKWGTSVAQALVWSTLVCAHEGRPPPILGPTYMGPDWPGFADTAVDLAQSTSGQLGQSPTRCGGDAQKANGHSNLYSLSILPALRLLKSIFKSIMILPSDPTESIIVLVLSAVPLSVAAAVVLPKSLLPPEPTPIS
ncbi:hypothetical protein DFP72DRAFT_860257 [Ephemerocybe angulata]|uniref:Uncharacterized protein n=1 Tax=Ephemerocybe angulata TaxID=980116 RepID=A0A8H6HBA1_9AGAR|nr:hypothetical protein DFP72DRAFT_860257 [Tulosesus angulatus]